MSTVWLHTENYYGSGGEEYDSREEAINAGREEYEGRPFYVFACSPISAADMVSFACSGLFDHVKERVWENFATEDEQEPPWSDVDAAEAELNAFLREWAERHLTHNWRTVSIHPEEIGAAAATASPTATPLESKS